MELISYLRKLVEFNGSDLYLITKAPPVIKVNGRMRPIPVYSPTSEDNKGNTIHLKAPKAIPFGRIRNMAYELMTPDQCKQFEERPEMNLAITEEGIGRFRVNIFKQRNDVNMVIRFVKTEIPEISSLGLPEILKKMVKQQRGLILFVGATGTGKSTSMAALIDHRNQSMDGHIVTIEEPIEFIHSHKRSLISQREIGVDTVSYDDALLNTLRQAPDAILIGEIRSSKTMEYSLTFAETGHLVLSTLHGNNASQAIDRIVNFFHEERRQQILNDLATNLCAIVSQRLLPTKDGKSLCAAFEILLNTKRISDLIIKGDVAQLDAAMEKGEDLGMLTFDMSLIELYKQGKISYEEAIRNANSENNVRLKIKLLKEDSNEPKEEKSSKKKNPFINDSEGDLNISET